MEEELEKPQPLKELRFCAKLNANDNRGSGNNPAGEPCQQGDQRVERRFQNVYEQVGGDPPEAESSEPVFSMALVREFLQRHFTIENEIHVLQQDKAALRDEFKEKGLDLKTINAAIAIAKKRQTVRVSMETLEELILEVENRLPAPEN